MDSTDHAQDLEQRERAAAIKAATSHSDADAPGREDCAGCGDPIAPARRLANPSATRCITCQTVFEGS